MKTIQDRLKQTQAEKEKNLKNLQEAVGVQITHTPNPAENELVPNSFLLGKRVYGDEVPEGFHVKKDWVYIDTDHMLEHLLILGSTGKGKTVFLTQLAHEILFSNEDLDLYVVDGKGDPEFAKRIAVMAHRAGKGPIPIMKLGWGDGTPTAVFDGFALGNAQAIYERLIAMFDLDVTRQSESEYYREKRRLIFQMVCGVNTHLQYGVQIPEPPRDFFELQRRYTPTWLKSTFGSSPEALIAIQSAEKSHSDFYSQLLGQINPLLPLIGKGGFKLGDSRVIVFSINTGSTSFNSQALFGFIGEAIKSYISTQPGGRLTRKTYWLIDEFKSLGEKNVETIIGQARSKRMSVTLAMLDASSMGEDPRVRDGIKGCNTQIIFQHKDATEIIRMAGTVYKPNSTIRIEEGEQKGLSISQEQEYKIDPQEVLKLPRGACFISSGGETIKMQVKMLDGFVVEEFNERTMEDLTVREDVLRPSYRPYTPNVSPASPTLPTSNQPAPF